MRLLQGARQLYWMWQLDRRSRTTLRQKLSCWRRGFTVQSAALYRLDEVDQRDFLPDFHATHLIKPINGSLAFYQHKLAQRALLLGAGIPQPATVAAMWDRPSSCIRSAAGSSPSPPRRWSRGWLRTPGPL
jgi:hypothetical protein